MKRILARGRDCEIEIGNANESANERRNCANGTESERGSASVRGIVNAIVSEIETETALIDSRAEPTRPNNDRTSCLHDRLGKILATFQRRTRLTYHYRAGAKDPQVHHLLPPTVVRTPRVAADHRLSGDPSGASLSISIRFPHLSLHPTFTDHRLATDFPGLSQARACTTRCNMGLAAFQTTSTVTRCQECPKKEDVAGIPAHRPRQAVQMVMVAMPTIRTSSGRHPRTRSAGARARVALAARLLPVAAPAAQAIPY